MENLSLKNKAGFITLTISLILIFARLSVFIYTPGRQASVEIQTVVLCGMYILLTTIILVNKNRLHSLNINNLFVSVFLCVGVYISLYFFGSPGSALVGVSVFLILFFGYSGKLQLKNAPISFWNSTLFVMVNCAFFFPYYANSQILLWGKLPVNIGPFFYTLPQVVFEEFIFRGLLWIILTRFLDEQKTSYVQALMFWLAHLNSLQTSPFTFWVISPSLGIILGFLVRKYKSLIPATMFHYAYNVLAIFGRSLA